MEISPQRDGKNPVIPFSATVLFSHSETHPVVRCSAISAGSTCAFREDEPTTAHIRRVNTPRARRRAGWMITLNKSMWHNRNAARSLVLAATRGPVPETSGEQTGAGWGSVGLVGDPVAGIQPPRPPIQFGSAPSPPAGDRSTGLPPDHQFSSSLLRSFRAVPDEWVRS